MLIKLIDQIKMQNLTEIRADMSKPYFFRATATLYGASNKDKILGCIEFTFKLDTC